MRKVIFGIVAEGGGDCVVLSTLLHAHLDAQGLKGCEISFKSLQPYVDNTSRSGYSEGGWEQVYKWCLANPPGNRTNSLFGTPLFANEMDNFNCSALVVHMDADICEVIGDKSSVVPVPSPEASAEIRGKFIGSVLDQWLWPEGAENDSRYILVPAVESTEAWLVAGLSDDEAPETNRMIQLRLAELDYQVVREKPVPKGIKATNKSASNFKVIADKAIVNIDRIVKRCPHFAAAAGETVAFVKAELVAA